MSIVSLRDTFRIPPLVLFAFFSFAMFVFAVHNSIVIEMTEGKNVVFQCFVCVLCIFLHLDLKNVEMRERKNVLYPVLPRINLIYSDKSYSPYSR